MLLMLLLLLLWLVLLCQRSTQHALKVVELRKHRCDLATHLDQGLGILLALIGDLTHHSFQLRHALVSRCLSGHILGLLTAQLRLHLLVFPGNLVHAFFEVALLQLLQLLLLLLLLLQLLLLLLLLMLLLLLLLLLRLLLRLLLLLLPLLLLFLLLLLSQLLMCCCCCCC